MLVENSRPHLFDIYNPQTSRFFDEMFATDSTVREHYETLLLRFNELSPAEIEARKQIVNVFFLNQGITFTVYGNNEGVERIFPFDIIPRIVPGPEWDLIERGLTQRITALNLFLFDL